MEKKTRQRFQHLTSKFKDSISPLPEHLENIDKHIHNKRDGLDHS